MELRQLLTMYQRRRFKSALLLVFLVRYRAAGDKFCGVDLEDAQNSVGQLIFHGVGQTSRND